MKADDTTHLEKGVLRNRLVGMYKLDGDKGRSLSFSNSVRIESVTKYDGDLFI